MTTTASSAFPDPHSILLPSLAYLRSMRDQTVRARELALRDAIQHFETVESDETDYRDLALLGLIGEALQVLEDLAHFGTAFAGEQRFPGPRLITAAMYSPFTVTNFYEGIKKRSPDELLALIGLRMPAGSGQFVSPREVMSPTEPFSEEAIAAFEAAERASADRLRNDLLQLAEIWTQLGGYFNAFKHGGLSLNRDDYYVVDEHGEEIDIAPSLFVWRRRRAEGEVRADMNLTPSGVADWVARNGWLALGLYRFAVEARLAVSDLIVFDEKGNVVEPAGVSTVKLPWRPWLREGDLPPNVREPLERLGFEFAASRKERQ